MSFIVNSLSYEEIVGRGQVSSPYLSKARFMCFQLLLLKRFILVQHIKTVLPGLKTRINAALVSVTKDHASYGEITESKQQGFEMVGFDVSASDYNPLDEPSPLGLRLRKSPSLLELIQRKLAQSTSPKSGYGKKLTGDSASGDKLKASNFPASIPKIGTCEYKSIYEGDLVAKCYFAKHKLVWEVLDGGLKKNRKNTKLL